ncbi:MAG: DUF1638 domain-containing protein [Spirochaetaceae bacterium]|jgi:hypothetical protein|nr:DUF1638 domain-containing protein [Spirochaetaceae bacterium]
MEEETCIIACETLREELSLIMECRQCSYPVVWVDAGKHVWPDKLHLAIQEALDALPPSCTTALALFGFCGNAMVGIRPPAQVLVFPRAADCIPLFLGSQAAREAAGARTYFFTEGYLRSSGNIATEFRESLKRRGKNFALHVVKTMMAHYRNIAVIDTGAFDPAKVLEELTEFSQTIGIPVSVIPGNLRLIDALLAGDWNRNEFLIVPPGETVTFEDALAVGKGQ